MIEWIAMLRRFFAFGCVCVYVCMCVIVWGYALVRALFLDCLLRSFAANAEHSCRSMRLWHCALASALFKLTWLVLGGDPAARSHRVEQFTAL